MEITSPDQLTGPVIREMREKLGMTQSAFWGPLCISKSRGSAYETQASGIDAATRLLVYLHHVCGFPVGLAHDKMKASGSIAGYIGNGLDEIGKAAALIERSVAKLNQAKKTLEGM